MSGTAPKPAEPISAKDLHDEIVAMFDEALARKAETTEPVETDARGG